jgi:uncharacterized lipoprotein
MKNNLLAVTALAGLVLLIAPASAQFADDAQTLFPETPSSDQYETDKDNLVIWEFSTKAEDEEGDPAAQSVEDICCDLNEAERANQAICIDVDFTCDR